MTHSPFLAYGVKLSDELKMKIYKEWSSCSRDTNMVDYCIAGIDSSLYIFVTEQIGTAYLGMHSSGVVMLIEPNAYLQAPKPEWIEEIDTKLHDLCDNLDHTYVESEHSRGFYIGTILCDW